MIYCGSSCEKQDVDLNSWFLKAIIARAADYLNSLGATPDIVQWVEQQQNQQFYINEFRKNPSLGLQDLQALQPKQKPRPYTSTEMARTRMFEEEPFRMWALVQFRKHRIGQPFETLDVGLTYNYSVHPRGIQVNLDLIYDWWRMSNGNGPKPEIASYTFEQAMQAQKDWHEAMAAEGDGSQYEPTDPALIVYGPQWSKPEWQGWTIQEVRSENDLEVEGNRMNHCVGGYCNYVSDGRMNVYSLRDPQNEPHVTMSIEPAGVIEQIKGNSNTNPKEEYKAMIREWFGEYQKTKPLNMGVEFNWGELKFIKNEDMDDFILQELTKSNDYGIRPDMTSFDIEELYEAAYNGMLNNRLGGYDYNNVRNAKYIGRAIAQAAWEYDEYLAKDYKLDNPEHQGGPLYPDLFKKKSAANWLQQKQDDNFDISYAFDWGHMVDEPYPQEDDYGTPQEYNAAVERYNELEGEAMTEIYKSTLPYALDIAIMEEISNLQKTNPITPAQKQQAQISSDSSSSAVNVASKVDPQ